MFRIMVEMNVSEQLRCNRAPAATAQLAVFFGIGRLTTAPAYAGTVLANLS